MSYGKVYSTYWTDEKILSVSDSAKLLGCYLLSSPHRNSIGCFRLPAQYIAADLGWGIEKIDQAIAELEAVCFIVRDAQSGWTLIKNLMKYDPPFGHKSATGALRVAQTVPRNIKVYSELYKQLAPILDRQLYGQPNALESPIEGASMDHTMPHRSPNPSPSPLPVPNPEPEPLPESRADARSTAKATRLPDDWLPGEPLTRWCETDLPGFDWQRETEVFRDYWKAAPGAKGRKQDWPAVWRNWMRRAAEGFGKINGANGHGKAGRPNGQANTARLREGIARAFPDLTGDPASD